MKNKKWIMLLALIVATTFLMCTQQYCPESDFKAIPVDNGRGVEITEYLGSSWTVRIPPRIQGLPVTTISGIFKYRDFVGAFYGRENLTSVTIPNSVKTIGDLAFANCQNLTSVTIGKSVTTIGDGAFGGTSLTSITIPNSVTTIGDWAFTGTGLTRVTIPNSVTTIGDQAFADTRLTSITIPNNVTTIGDQAFAVSDLTNINVGSGNQHFSSVNGVLYNKIQTTLIQAPGGISGNFVIPNSVTTIGNGAFADTGLTSVTIPNSVTTIGDYAFSGCIGLTNITIPASVTTIGSGAFSGCTGLTSITIPNSVTTIGDMAFSGCTNLTSVTFQGITLPTTSGWLFNDTSNLRIYIQAGSAVDNVVDVWDWWSIYNLIHRVGCDLPNPEWESCSCL
jgi:Flp pilus assembly protein protease CpaA